MRFQCLLSCAVQYLGRGEDSLAGASARHREGFPLAGVIRGSGVLDTVIVAKIIAAGIGYSVIERHRVWGVCKYKICFVRINIVKGGSGVLGGIVVHSQGFHDSG